jgi:anti-sigma-K factor RskA
MSDIDVHHLAAAYALDALDQRERAAFEAHYERCDVCRADVLEFRETMAEVAGSLSAPPPPSLKDRVMADIAVTRQLSPTLIPQAPVQAGRPRGSWVMLAAAAAVIIALVVGVVAFNGGDDDPFNDELAAVLEQTDSRMIELDNQSDIDGMFKVAWSPSMGKAVLMGEDLPVAPDGKAYELWLISGDQSMAMYILDPADDGQVHRTLPTPAEPTAWAITMEPVEGSAVATGDIMFIAEV